MIAIDAVRESVQSLGYHDWIEGIEYPSRHARLVRQPSLVAVPSQGTARATCVLYELSTVSSTAGVFARVHTRLNPASDLATYADDLINLHFRQGLQQNDHVILRPLARITQRYEMTANLFLIRIPQVLDGTGMYQSFRDPSLALARIRLLQFNLLN